MLIILLAYLAKFWVFGHRPVQAAAAAAWGGPPTRIIRA